MKRPRDYNNYKADPAKGRRCEACALPLVGIGSLCRKHLDLRRAYGHHKMRGLPTLRQRRQGWSGGRPSFEWIDLLPYSKQYLATHPISDEIRAQLREVITPGNAPLPTTKYKHPRAVLHRELVWWTDPRAQKKDFNGMPHGQRLVFTKRYEPETILGHLLACQLFIEERDRWPGDSADIVMAHCLSTFWKRRRMPGCGRSKPLASTTRRLIGERIRRKLGVWLITAAREILKDMAKQRQVIAQQPRKPEPPLPTLVTPTRPDRTAEQRKRFGISIANS